MNFYKYIFHSDFLLSKRVNIKACLLCFFISWQTNTFAQITITTVSPNDTICSGGTVKLTAMVNPITDTLIDKLWTITPITGFSGGTLTNTSTGSITFTTAGTYTLTFTSNDNTASQIIYVAQKPTMTSITPSPATICQEEAVTLTANGLPDTLNRFTITWTSLATGGLDTTKGNPVTAHPTVNSNYVATITNNLMPACSTSQSATVIVKTKPKADAGQATMYGCVGQTITLDGSASTSGSTYAWSPTTGLSSATVASPTLTLSTTPSITPYVLTITKNGCTDEDTVMVSSTAKPVAVIYPAATFVCTDIAPTSTTLIGDGANYQNQFSWSGGALSNTLGQVQIVSPTSSTTYTLTVNLGANCTASTSVTIDTKKCNEPEVFIPDGFSPNGDGVNDYFEITNASHYPDNELSVFNRYGDLVYSKKGYNNDWNGKSTHPLALGLGKVPEGTYFIIFKKSADYAETKKFITIVY